MCFNLQQSDSMGEVAVCCTVNGITINPGNRFAYPVCGSFFFYPSLPSMTFSEPCDGVRVLDAFGYVALQVLRPLPVTIVWKNTLGTTDR